jgi:hypothetical protein
MAICPYCGHDNRPGEFYCDECAREIYERVAGGVVATRELEGESPLGVFAVPGVVGARFSPDCYLVIHVRDAITPIVIQPDKGRIVFGRRSDKSNRVPDVDLTQFNALEKGVSHIHAAVDFNTENPTLIDLGSVNGTYVNGQRLTTQKGHLICDGDEIRLGRLVAHVYFQCAA